MDLRVRGRANWARTSNLVLKGDLQLTMARGPLEPKSPRGNSDRDSALVSSAIEDVGQGDFVKADCATYHHVALLTPVALLKLGLSPRD